MLQLGHLISLGNNPKLLQKLIVSCSVSVKFVSLNKFKGTTCFDIIQETNLCDYI